MVKRLKRVAECIVWSPEPDVVVSTADLANPVTGKLQSEMVTDGVCLYCEAKARVVRDDRQETVLYCPVCKSVSAAFWVVRGARAERSSERRPRIRR